MTTIKYVLALFAIVAFSVAATPAAMAGDSGVDTPAAKFVQKMGDNALASLTGKDISAAEREKRVRNLLKANFDIPTIGRFALGTYWKDASDAQKKEYLSLFEDMIVKTYTQRFAEYSGQALKVAGSLSRNEKDSIVSSQIIQKDGPPVSVDWVVRNKGGMKVIDVMVEGISMSVTQRSDFASVIQSGDGTVATLITSLRDRKMAAAKP